MSSQRMLLLAAIAVAVLAAAWWLTGNPERQASSAGKPNAVGELFLPELATHINSADFLEVRGAENSLVASLRRHHDQWLVENSYGYPADWPKLRDLLAAMSQMRIDEVKTANPDLYSRLGVEDIDQAQAQGLQVELAAGGKPFAFIVGTSPDLREGRHVRMVGSEQSYLLDRDLSLEPDVRDWLNRDIVSVQPDQIHAIDITHADGEILSLLRDDSAGDTRYQLLNLPEGRELTSSYILNTLAGGFSSLLLDSVVPEVNFTFSNPTEIRLETVSGNVILATLERTDAGSFIRLAPGTEPVDPPPEDTVDSDTLTNSAATNAAESSEAIDIGSLAERWSGWVYQIPDYKFDSLNKRLDDVLKPTD